MKIYSKSAKRKAQLEHLQAAIKLRNETIQLMAEKLVELGNSYQDLKDLNVPERCLFRIYLSFKTVK